ncbi:MAG: hypothetical protein AAF624_08105 [Bacteroidota bacterium]
MQQTLLAVLAIVVVGLFALGQQQDVASSERAVYEREMQDRAAEKVRELLYEIQALPFDEADIGSPSIRTNTAGLASNLGPGSDEPNRSYYDDVDDFNGYTTVATVNHDSAEGGNQSHQIYLRVAVRYVRPESPDQAASGKSLAKEIVVEGFYGGTAPATGLEPDVRLSQVVTPTWHQIHN